jgi:hypothetical protein
MVHFFTTALVMLIKVFQFSNTGTVPSNRPLPPGLKIFAFELLAPLHHIWKVRGLNLN